ncbi:MAG: YHS domain-containing (seleno)protein [Xanthobacteraceae bacterium]
MQFTSAHSWVRGALAGALALIVAALPPVRVQAAVTNELVVADQLAGIALFGFDPVSYFLDGSARIGQEFFSLSFGGLTWHFRSEANRAAFRAQPDVYVPRFGGYDPIALVRGAPVAGHPSLFVVHEGQLFLFHQLENRTRFLAEPGPAIEAARAAWPLVRRSLVH